MVLFQHKENPACIFNQKNLDQLEDIKEIISFTYVLCLNGIRFLVIKKEKGCLLCSHI